MPTKTNTTGNIQTDHVEQRLTRIIEQAQTHDTRARELHNNPAQEHHADYAYHRQKAFELRSFARELKRDITLLKTQT